MKNINMPAIALRGMTVLPDMVIHFDISRKKSIRAVEKAMETDQKIFLVAQNNVEVADPGIEDLFSIGTISKVKQLIKLPNGVLRVLTEGISKATLELLSVKDGMLYADITIEDTQVEEIDHITEKAMVDTLHELIKRYAIINPKMSRDILKQWLNIKNISTLLKKIAIDYPMEYEDRQRFLELNSIDEMYDYIAVMIKEDIEIWSIKSEIAQRVKEKVDKHQREYVLREQMKVLSEELDGEDSESEIQEFLNKTDKLQASDEVKEKIRKEIKRYKMIAQSSAEAGVERGYIETLLSLPWDKESKDNYDLSIVEDVLNSEHFGMTKVKERVLESLAVRSITDKGTTPIICLVGPPGTGKTSIVKSVAKALNKEYVRICLGGVRDEAEIRGHRKTYIGAMPGRIINGLKSAGVKNPVMLLDEIDKISSDYKGDTASALLEVLDGEQNSRFVDHYVEIPTDLSEVLFIATANDLSEVSRPLLDRMEIIEVNSYTQTEKFHIAKEHLIPKQIEKNGLAAGQVKFSDNAIRKIIDTYTREAGVRSLERQIACVLRKIVKDLYDKGILSLSCKNELDSVSNEASQALQDKNSTNVEKKPRNSKILARVTDKDITKYLGKEKYTSEKISKKNEIGIVHGLAWTSVGGDTLEIEVNVMPGKQDLILTGQMGDVMQESARIALTYVRSVVCKHKYNISEDFFDNNIIHLHIPEGAVPKDGPSAGVTMSTAILSAVTQIAVKGDVAMTGEVTLRGRVLPVGGLKEKLLAANMAGIKKVLVPDKNKADIDELDEEITDGMEVVFVKDMSQVLENALVQQLF